MASDALVIAGGGHGNLIQATPMIVAAARLHDSPVDVWLAGDAPRLAEVIRGHETVRRVSSQLKEAMGSVKKYAAVYYTFLKRGKQAKKVPAAAYYPSGGPMSRGETAHCMSSVRKGGWKGKTPHTFCCHDPFPENLPAGILIGLATGSKTNQRWKLKRYPPESYARVCVAIGEKFPDVRFVHAGTLNDDEVVHPAVTDFRGVGTIREQFGLLRKCAAVISNDSGLMHAAAAQGVPTFGVFGPTNVLKNLPPQDATAIRLKAGALSCQPCQGGKHGIKARRKDGSKCALECFQQLHPKSVANPVISFLRGIIHEVYDCDDGV